MKYTKSVLLVFVWCCAFEMVCPTLILFNALKNTVSHTRCKLHKIGTKIVSHDHRTGDPCEEPEKPQENNNDNINHYQITEQSSGFEANTKETRHGQKDNQQSEMGHQMSTETYPSSLDIDVRMGHGGGTTSKSSTSTRKFATVPPGGGKRIFDAPCKDGQVGTADGCMEEI